MNFKELEPAIYRIKAKEKKGEFDLIKVDTKYSIKNKLYGIVNKLLYRVNRLLELKMYKHITLLMSGGKGLGKTTTMNKVCNLLLEHKIPVIEVKYINISIELIEFLSSFRNVAIYIDEFGKYFTSHYQDKMLTLLNQQEGFYRIFIIGENDTYKISSFILDRMERTRYHVPLIRIPNSDLEEYCLDNNLPRDLIDSLLRINKTSNNISYDTLESIVEEHRMFPELNFTELTEIMNCHGIIGVSIVDLKDVTIDSEEFYVDNFSIVEGFDRLQLEYFKSGSPIIVSYELKPINGEDKKDEQVEPIPGFFNQPNNKTTTRITSDNVISINDIDDTMLVQSKTAKGTLDILIGTKVVPNLRN